MEFVKYEVEGAVAVVTIDRQKALNALNSQVLEELDATFNLPKGCTHSFQFIAPPSDGIRCVVQRVAEPFAELFPAQVSCDAKD